MIRLPNNNSNHNNSSSNNNNNNSNTRTILSPPSTYNRLSEKQQKTASGWKSTLLSDELNNKLFNVEEYYRNTEESNSTTNFSKDESKSEGVVETLDQFYSWFSQMESLARQHGADSQFNLEHLISVSNQTKLLIEELDLAIANLDRLSELHAEVESKTKQLHTETEALLNEKKQLGLLASALHEQLTHFKALDLVTAKLNHTKLQVTDPSFLEALQRIDESLRFIRAHPIYRDAELYLGKFAQLQSRGLALLKEHVVREFRAATETIAHKMAGGKETAESLYYIEFRAIAVHVKPFCVELERRATNERAQLMLAQCQDFYFSCRRSLCSGVVTQNLKMVSALPELSRCAAEGASYLSSLFHLEIQLYHSFFDRDCAGIQELLSDFSGLWFDELRPLLIRSKSITALCNVIQALKVRSTANASMGLLLKKMIATAQERVVFLVQFFIRDEISGFVPQATDLDFPARLLTESTGETTDWYVVVERCVVLLRRLRGCFDDVVFDGLAQQLCLATVVAVVKAAHVLSQSSTVDSELFLLKHVSILRDEVRELRLARSLTERSIDFSKMRLALQRYDWKLMLPELQTQSFDARKDLELLLVHTLESLVSHCLSPALAGLTGLLAKCAAHHNTALKEEPWLATEKVQAMLRGVLEGLESRLPETLAATKQYLVLAHRRSVFAAFQNACLEPLAKLRSLLCSVYQDTLEEHDPLLVAIAAIKVLVERTCAEML